MGARGRRNHERKSSARVTDARTPCAHEGVEKSDPRAGESQSNEKHTATVLMEGPDLGLDLAAPVADGAWAAEVSYDARDRARHRSVGRPLCGLANRAAAADAGVRIAGINPHIVH